MASGSDFSLKQKRVALYGFSGCGVAGRRDGQGGYGIINTYGK